MEQKYRVSFRFGEASFDIESTDLNWLKNKEKEYVIRLLEKTGLFIKSTNGDNYARTAILPQNLTTKEFYMETKLSPQGFKSKYEYMTQSTKLKGFGKTKGYSIFAK